MAIKKININNQSFEINYEIINPKSKKDLIILHGWGSNKELMSKAFSNIATHFRHIYVDMPGFGKSSNDYVLDSYDYSEILERFLKSLGANKDIIIGHSFGGKIATLLKPKLLILLSNSGIVTEKPLSIRLKIKLFKALKSLGGGTLFGLFASKDVKGMSENMYGSFKKIVDEDFSEIFASYSGNALIFWGKEDTATPLSSGKKVTQLIKNSKFYPLIGDHYFFLNHAIFIEKAIERELNGEF